MNYGDFMRLLSVYRLPILIQYWISSDNSTLWLPSPTHFVAFVWYYWKTIFRKLCVKCIFLCLLYPPSKKQHTIKSLKTYLYGARTDMKLRNCNKIVIDKRFFFLLSLSSIFEAINVSNFPQSTKQVIKLKWRNK